MAAKSPKTSRGISLDDAVSELVQRYSAAIDFASSELEPDWELAETYYNGDCGIDTVEGRSNVVKTEVRDAVRNTMPSIMRALLSTRKPIEYTPSSIKHAPWVNQQAEYCTQLFWSNGGYSIIRDSVHEALKLKLGVIKVFWEPEPYDEFSKHTRITYDTFNQLISDPDYEVTLAEVCDTELGNDGQAVPFYDVEGYRRYPNGKICMQSIPLYEFFISGNVNSIEEALERGTHGQRSVVTVAEAQKLGLTYDEWDKLSDEDPEDTDHQGSSRARRGHTKQDKKSQPSEDGSLHTFTLYEAYARFDLDGTGVPKTYVFYLGGSSHTYLHHEEVEDSPYTLVDPLPLPHVAHGLSIADLVLNEQDTSTSLLRAMIDNAHASNNARLAGDPRYTNFDDLMNPEIGAPIRKKAGDTLQPIVVPYTGQGTLQALQYLDQDTQNKVGITKAAQGLDTDALQSTDKDAVRNTIMTSQGQTEFMVRNIVETTLIRVFRLLLRLSIRHHDNAQLLKTKGTYVPIDISVFDPDAFALPTIGLGSAEPAQKVASLGFVYSQQQQMMDKFGPNNPFTTYAQMYNTLEDLLEAQGLFDAGRYFKVVTPAVEAQWAKAQAEQMDKAAKEAAAAQPMDPSEAFIKVEQLKAQVKQLELTAEHQRTARELELKALTAQEQADLERDKMVQARALSVAKEATPQLGDKIKTEQANNAKLPIGTETGSKRNA